MSIEIQEVLSTNGTDRNKTYGAGEVLSFQVNYAVDAARPGARMRVFFLAEMVENLLWNAIDDPNALEFFKPQYATSFDLDLAAGGFYAWAAWRLPTSDPRPSRLTSVDLRDQAIARWPFRSWSGLWSLTWILAAFGPGTTDEDWAYSSNRWLYNIRY